MPVIGIFDADLTHLIGEICSDFKSCPLVWSDGSGRVTVLERCAGDEGAVLIRNLDVGRRHQFL